MHYADRATVCVSARPAARWDAASAPPARPASTATYRRRDRRAGRPRRTAGRDAGRRVSNVVFMGMGEPLANYDRTWAAVERLHDDLGLSARHLTVSTVGIVPGIRRLAAEAPPGEPRRLAPRRQRRAPRRAGADQPPLPARRRGRRVPASGPPVATGGCRSSGRSSTASTTAAATPSELAALARAARGPREPHPAQPDAGLAHAVAPRRPA